MNLTQTTRLENNSTSQTPGYYEDYLSREATFLSQTHKHAFISLGFRFEINLIQDATEHLAFCVYWKDPL